MALSTIPTPDERAEKLQAQLDGWAELLGISDHYWVPKGHPDRAAFEPFFYSLNAYGRGHALDTSRLVQKHNSELVLHAALQKRTADENARLRAGLDEMTSARDGLRAEIGRMEEQNTKLKAALEKAEDFVVTHAAQGDEKLLAVIGAALDGG